MRPLDPGSSRLLCRGRKSAFRPSGPAGFPRRPYVEHTDQRSLRVVANAPRAHTGHRWGPQFQTASVGDLKPICADRFAVRLRRAERNMISGSPVINWVLARSNRAYPSVSLHLQPGSATGPQALRVPRHRSVAPISFEVHRISLPPVARLQIRAG